jgi:hypothetical protein
MKQTKCVPGRASILARKTNIKRLQCVRERNVECYIVARETFVTSTSIR